MRNLTGHIDIKQKNLKMEMDSDINELSGTHKYLMHYVDLDLSQWGLKKGKGRVHLNVDNIGKRIKIYSKLDVKNLFSNEAPIKNFNAVVNVQNNLVDVDFRF